MRTTDSRMKRRAALAAVLACLGAHAAAQQWQQHADGSYVCGGVAQEGMEKLRTMREAADIELVFTQGARGAWMADVDVSVAAAGAEPLHFKANGPACLLRLPAGQYTIEAEAAGVTRMQRISTDGPVKRVMFNWPD